MSGTARPRSIAASPTWHVQSKLRGLARARAKFVVSNGRFAGSDVVTEPTGEIGEMLAGAGTPGAVLLRDAILLHRQRREAGWILAIRDGYLLAPPLRMNEGARYRVDAGGGRRGGGSVLPH